MSGNPTFTCPNCGKRFTWKPQFAGRKVSCSCGRVFEATLGLGGLEAHGDEYDVVDETATTAPPLRPPSTMSKRAMATTAAPARAPTSPARPAPPGESITALYPQRRRATARDRDAEDAANVDPEAANPLLHTYLPYALLVIGVGGRLGETAHAVEGQSMTVAFIRVIIELHLGALVMLGGAYIAAAVMGVNFGSLARASVKLAAISVFTSAIAALAASIDKSPYGIRGMVLGMHVALLLYFALFYAFFDIDLQESLTTVLIVWALQWILAMTLMAIMSHG
jgi:hypothetical protein